MNGKKLACVVMLILVAALAYAGQIVHQNAQLKRKEAEAADRDRTKAEDELRIADISLTTLKADTDELRRFLQSWTPFAERVQTQSEVEQVMLASLRSANLLIMSQKFEMKQKTGMSFMPKVVRASLVLEDDYAKTINWIGEMERRLPLARTTNCRITGGDSGRQVHAEISFEVPLADLKLAPAAATAKEAAAKGAKKA